MIALWSLALLVALLLTLLASQRAVSEVTQLAAQVRLPPFFIGLTLVAVGTDLPEIANSILASISQHGDLNVGNAIGSTVTQVTLVLGLLPFLCGAFEVGWRQAVLTGSATAVALGLGVVLVADGKLSRLDGLMLVTCWIIASAIVWRYSPSSPEIPSGSVSSPRKYVVNTLFFLGLVGIGAAGVVVAFVRLSELLGIPEYVISFFAASIGTSLPELVFDVGALRRRAGGIAMGDLFGSSLVDATLSIGIGPLLVPIVVSSALAIRGGLAAAGVLVVVTLLFSRLREHDWRSGVVLLLLYAAFYPLLLLD